MDGGYDAQFENLPDPVGDHARVGRMRRRWRDGIHSLATSAHANADTDADADADADASKRHFSLSNI